MTGRVQLALNVDDLDTVLVAVPKLQIHKILQRREGVISCVVAAGPCSAFNHAPGTCLYEIKVSGTRLEDVTL